MRATRWWWHNLGSNNWWGCISLPVARRERRKILRAVFCSHFIKKKNTVKLIFVLIMHDESYLPSWRFAGHVMRRVSRPHEFFSMSLTRSNNVATLWPFLNIHGPKGGQLHHTCAATYLITLAVAPHIFPENCGSSCGATFTSIFRHKRNVPNFSSVIGNWKMTA